MNKMKFKDERAQNLIKISFFIIAATLILQSFPREGRFRYNFHVLAAADDGGVHALFIQ